MALIRPWTADERAQARAILGRHTSVMAACPEIAEALGRLVTPRSLRDVFQSARERGEVLFSPAHYLRGGINAPAVSSVEPALERRTVPPVPDRAFIQRSEPRVTDGLPLSKSGRTTFVISDMHMPYHDPEVWATKLAIIRHLRPEAVVIIGDCFDFYAASFFPKDPTRKSRVIDEVEAGLPCMDELEACRVPSVFFLQGNHEERLERCVVQLAPMLHGMVRTLPEILRIKERGWHWVPYKRSIAIGKMRYSHDFTRCGVNAPRQALLDVGRSVTFGHTHRLGVAFQGTIEDDAHVALNVGWGGDFEQVDYAHRDRARRDWMHGCGIVDEDERGFVWPQAVAIINGTARIRGQKVAA